MRQELRGIPGVLAAEVSYDDKLARVRYRPDLVSPERLVEAVDATGFDAELLDPEDELS